MSVLNARSLHKHIEDVRRDINYSKTDISIFSELRFTQLDNDKLSLLEDDNYTFCLEMMPPQQIYKIQDNLGYSSL